MEEEKNKVWLDENGIVNVKVVGATTEEDIEELDRKVKEFSRKVPTRRRVLVDLTECDPLLYQTSKERKRGAEVIRGIFDNVALKKTALFSESITMRTIVSFIAVATGRQEDIGIFKTREEALKWLKKP